ncbi:26S proteasome non-ATPase regulatory subunit 4 homolog isoform X2, partial [Tanacetum coccineum]
SNLKNRVGVATLGLGATRWPHTPHSDIEHFLTNTLERIPWGGDFSLIAGLSHSPLGFGHIPLDMKRRMLVFVAGPGYLMDLLLDIGKHFKERDIALDVVSFEDEDQEFDSYKTKRLRSFVAAANRANNSHFARVPRHSSSSSSVRHILVSSKILRHSEAEAVPLVEEVVPLVEEVIPKTMNNKKKKKLTRNRRKKNHHSQDDPEEEPVSSSSPPPVILPAHIQVPQKYKNHNQLVFGSWQMHQLVDVLSPSS